MNRVINALDRVIYAILAVLIVVMLAVGAMQVFWRYVLQNSLSWSEELLRYLYVWVTMLGICMGIRRKGLASISSVADYIEKKTKIGRDVLAVISFMAQIATFVLLAYFGMKLSISTMKQLSPAMRVSMGYVYMAMPIGGVLAMIYTFDEMADYFKGRRKMAAPEGGDAQ